MKSKEENNEHKVAVHYTINDSIDNVPNYSTLITGNALDNYHYLETKLIVFKIIARQFLELMIKSVWQRDFTHEFQITGSKK